MNHFVHTLLFRTLHGLNGPVHRHARVIGGSVRFYQLMADMESCVMDRTRPKLNRHGPDSAYRFNPWGRRSPLIEPQTMNPPGRNPNLNPDGYTPRYF